MADRQQLIKKNNRIISSNSKILRTSKISADPPVGAIVFYWYGTYEDNWSYINKYGTAFNFIKNSDNLEISKTLADWGGHYFQTSVAYNGGAGKYLHVKYELEYLESGTMQEMTINLGNATVSGFDTSAEISRTTFSTEGIRNDTSVNDTGGTPSYYPTFYISNTENFRLKIYELYYL